MLSNLSYDVPIKSRRQSTYHNIEVSPIKNEIEPQYSISVNLIIDQSTLIYLLSLLEDNE